MPGFDLSEEKDVAIFASEGLAGMTRELDDAIDTMQSYSTCLYIIWQGNLSQIMSEIENISINYSRKTILSNRSPNVYSHNAAKTAAITSRIVGLFPPWIR